MPDFLLALLSHLNRSTMETEMHTPAVLYVEVLAKFDYHLLTHELSRDS